MRTRIRCEFWGPREHDMAPGAEPGTSYAAEELRMEEELTQVTRQSKDWVWWILITVMGIVGTILGLLVGVGDMYGQAPDVVFQSAYQRNFVVTNCSNATPIVVTVRDPSTFNADNELPFRNMQFMPLDNGSLVTISGVLGNTACNVTDNAITVLTPTTFSLTGTAGNGSYLSGGIGVSDTISDDIPSVVMPNMGAGGHLISVEFPLAGADVTPIQVRIEAADVCPDPPFCANGDWRPISTDVIVANVETPSGTGRFNMVRANGAWRAIRINSLAVTPALAPMRVDYTGMPFPIGAIICTLGPTGFCELEPPFGGGGSAARATFALCLGSPCTTGLNVTNRVIITGPISFAACFAQAKTAPTGADLVFDVNLNGVTSIFVPGGNPRIAAGQNVAPIVQTFAVSGSAGPDDFLTVDIDQVGSATAGQDVTVVCTYQ